MKNKLFLIVALSMLALSLAGCATPVVQAQSTDGKTIVRQINVQGTGKVILAPDLAYVSIGVRSQAENVADALTENNNQATAVASTLKELGVDPKDVQTSAFNVYPQQEFGPDGKPTKSIYVVQNTVNVTVRDLNKMGQILDVVVRNGANAINGISFDVKDKPKAISEARRLAIEDARKQAQEMAAAAGVTLGDLQTMSVSDSSGPVPVYDGKGGAMSIASQVPVAAGQLEISMSALLTYGIK